MRDAFETGGQLPPQTGKRWWKVFGVQQTGKLKVVFLADRWTVCWTHYDKVTSLCDRTPTCELCRAAEGGKPVGSRWNAYVPAHSFLHGQEAIIHLTEGAAQQIDKMARAKGTMRGLHVEMWRKPAKKPGELPANNAPVVVKEIRWHPESELPPSFPVIDSLIRMWGVADAYAKRGFVSIVESQQQPARIASRPAPSWEEMPY